MATKKEIDKMILRRNAAQNTLRFFTDISSITSTNSPCPVCCDDYIEVQRLCELSFTEPKDIMSKMVYSIESDLGNCLEKACICFSSLYSHPLFIEDSIQTSTV
ncbi:MAG: hypothetical protein KAH18_03655 [Psychromonas sp.]|nr:hypothetical protein [Psychromonas sp.]